MLTEKDLDLLYLFALKFGFMNDSIKFITLFVPAEYMPKDYSEGGNVL